ncbi:MAG: AAA family ATPase [Bryobacteraceae bacterium]
MISSIRIEGYRGFDSFEMDGLGRINLLVGTNNSGKTSVLEAIHLLCSRGDPASLWQALGRRGERVPPTLWAATGSPAIAVPELDVAHLFSGHELRPESSIRISAKNQGQARSIEYTMAVLPPRGHLALGKADESDPSSRLALAVTGSPKPTLDAIPLTRSGGLTPDALNLLPRGVSSRTRDVASALFITPESFSGEELVGMWNAIALTASEGLVLKALQFLDQKVERIAAQVPSGQYFSEYSRGGFIVKRAGSEQPVPIGSMGDGMWRMLAMAIAITQCRGGVLLVDEIDTGLHYSVMSRMWDLMYNAAQDLDVQIFATTHSYDCVYSLAQFCEPKRSVTVQRIEPGKRRAVPYDEEEITVAASRDIEVR